MHTGARPTTCRSARSTCSTIPLLREPLAAEHVKPRLLGPLGHDAGPELRLRPPEPGDQGARAQRDLRHRPGPRRPGPGRQRVPRGHLQRGLSAHRSRRGRAAAAVSPVLLPGRHPEPRRAGDARLDPRGRRARLRAAARLRRRVRQPRPARGLRGRRRRGRDRPARRELAFEQVPQPGARRRGAAGPASERLQDRQPDGAGADPDARSCSALLEGYGYAPRFVEGDEPADDAPADGRDARRGPRTRSQRSSAAHARTATRSGRAGR